MAKLYREVRSRRCGIKEFTVQGARLLPGGLSTGGGVQRKDKSRLSCRYCLNGFRLLQERSDCP